MNYSNYRITLDIRKTVSNVQLTAKKGDAGRKVYITLSDKGKPCEISEESYAVFAGVKPDGKLLYNKTTIENNTIIYEMTQQTTAVPGLVACEVKLFDSMSNLLTSPKLTILVDDTVVPDEEIVSKDEITAFAELVFEAREVIDVGNQVIEEGREVTDAANTATQSANDAAAGANQATERANDAADRAEAGATQVIQAVEATNTATTNANNAAANARAAAQETNAFLGNAENALETITEIVQDGEDAPPIVCTAEGKTITANDSADRMLRGLTVYGKTTQDGTPTPENPVELVSAGKGGSIKEIVAGNNLLDLRNGNSGSGTGGVAHTNNGDGSYKRSGTATDAYGNVWFAGGYDVLPNASNVIITLEAGKTYYIRDCALYTRIGGGVGSVAVFDPGASSVTGIAGTLTVNASKYPDGIKITGIRNPQMVVGGVYNDTLYPAVYLGNKALVWEPCKNQYITLSTPNGLPGIKLGATIPDVIENSPAHMSGVYWDEETQAYWIGDTKDGARGKFVQRVKLTTITSCEWYDANNHTALCNLTYYPVRGKAFHGLSEKLIRDSAKFSNKTVGAFIMTTTTNADWSDYMRASIVLPVGAATTRAEAAAWLIEQGITILHQLYEPIETDLTAEEKAAFAALHSNKPTTTVYNDAGAHQKIAYIADTKTYIDNKFAALSAALLNN